MPVPITTSTGCTSSRALGLRDIVALAGASTAGVVFVGVIGLVNSKYMSWKTYRDAFETKPRELPRPLDQAPLEWGVKTTNTWFAMAPDMALPVLFMVLWVAVLAIR